MLFFMIPLAAAAAAQINDSEGKDEYFYQGFFLPELVSFLVVVSY